MHTDYLKMLNLLKNQKKKGKRKPKGKNEDKEEEDPLSPIEIEAETIKQAYYTRVDALHEEFIRSKLTYEEWKNKVTQKYNALRLTVLQTYPDAWEILEFTLCVKSILSISNQDLPFMGVLLAVPSSMKTLILELFRGYPLTLS